jgi:hypothetical protein
MCQANVTYARRVLNLQSASPQWIALEIRLAQQLEPWYSLSTCRFSVHANPAARGVSDVVLAVGRQ